MIIKMLRCKQRSDIGRLVDYVLSDKERIANINDTFFIAHNMYARDRSEFKKAFYDNDAFRKKRKNSVVIYHEVLSFSSKDKITLEMLEDITQKYIALRANDAVVLAKPHIEEGHIHVHILISGTACCSSKVMRLDNKQFTDIRKSIEAYQIKKYPQLHNSIVHINKKDQYRSQEKAAKNTRKERGLQTKKRMGAHKKLDKEKLQKALFEMLDYSQTKDDFMRFLEQENLELYLYRGKLTGVIYKGRKYRFRTLGIPKERLLALEQDNRQVISQKKQKPDLVKSILNNKYLENHLRKQDKIQQKQWLESMHLQTHQACTQQLGIVRIKEIINILLREARTMKQLVYFAQKVGLSPYERKGVVVGFSFCNQEYSFVELDIQEEVSRLRELQQGWEQKRQAKEQEVQNRDLGVNIALDLGMDFLR